MTANGEATKVTFYELTQSDEQDDGHFFLCRLIEKAWSLGHYILVLSNNDAVMRALDEKLWQFSQESFLPHGIYGEVSYSPVQLSTEIPANASRQVRDILINLTDSAPAPAAEFKRIIELVPFSEHKKNQSRVRFKQYRAMGLQPEFMPTKKRGS